MPNRDGTGPEGQGPLSGRQQGKCESAKPCPRSRGRNFSLGTRRERRANQR